MKKDKLPKYHSHPFGFDKPFATIEFQKEPVPHVCKTCWWLEQEIKHICTCEETPAINVFGYEDTFGCNFWRAK